MRPPSISYCINNISELKFRPLFKILNKKLFIIALENDEIINYFST
jgi:hypothetical protein